SDLYSGRGRARHQSGVVTCASDDADSAANHITRVIASLRTDELRYTRGWGSVSTALDADGTIGDHHADPGQVSLLNTVEQILSSGLLRGVEEDEASLASVSNQAAV